MPQLGSFHIEGFGANKWAISVAWEICWYLSKINVNVFALFRFLPSVDSLKITVDFFLCWNRFSCLTSFLQECFLFFWILRGITFWQLQLLFVTYVYVGMDDTWGEEYTLSLTSLAGWYLGLLYRNYLSCFPYSFCLLWIYLSYCPNSYCFCGMKITVLLSCNRTHKPKTTCPTFLEAKFKNKKHLSCCPDTFFLYLKHLSCCPATEYLNQKNPVLLSWKLVLKTKKNLSCCPASFFWKPKKPILLSCCPDSFFS